FVPAPRLDIVGHVAILARYSLLIVSNEYLQEVSICRSCSPASSSATTSHGSRCSIRTLRRPAGRPSGIACSAAPTTPARCSSRSSSSRSRRRRPRASGCSHRAFSIGSPITPARRSPRRPSGSIADRSRASRAECREHMAASVTDSGPRHRVVVVGGGFGGLQAVRKLRRAPVDVTLVDRQNYTLFQPLVYQVATGGLAPADIAAPLRSVFRRQRNVRVVLGTVTEFDLGRREVVVD